MGVIMNLDLINWLDGELAEAIHGDMHTFTVPAPGIEAEKVLRQYFIPLWGRAVEMGSGETSFKVKAKQAQWAEYLLCCAGIPIHNKLINPRNRAVYEETLRTGVRRMPTPRQPKGMGAHGFVSGVVDMVGAALGEATHQVSGRNVRFGRKRQK